MINMEDLKSLGLDEIIVLTNKKRQIILAKQYQWKYKASKIEYTHTRLLDNT